MPRQGKVGNALYPYPYMAVFGPWFLLSMNSIIIQINLKHFLQGFQTFLLTI